MRPAMAGMLSLAAVMLLSPLAGAHGEAPPARFDPLDFAVDLYPTADGSLALQAPGSQEAVPVPARAPGEETTPVVWALEAPFGVSLASPAKVLLTVRAEDATVAQDPTTGTSFTLSLGIEGSELRGSRTNVTLASPAMAPGETATIEATLQAPGQDVDPGQTLELWVRGQAPQPDSRMSYVVGTEDASRMDLELRAQDVEALGLDLGPYKAFVTEDILFRPPEGSAAVTVEVRHDEVHFSSATLSEDTRAFLLFKGVEGIEQAGRAHASFTPDARNANAHAFQVGEGSFVTYPGLTVVVPIQPAEEVNVTCTRNCPGGEPFNSTITWPDLAANSTSPAKREGVEPGDVNESNGPGVDDEEVDTQLPIPASWVAVVGAGVAVSVAMARRRG